MAKNDSLKRSFDYNRYQKRYLVFVFSEMPGGGCQDIIGDFSTLCEIEQQFVIQSEAPLPIGIVDLKGNFGGVGRYIEILDMDERRFIDLGELTFGQYIVVQPVESY